MSPNNLLVLVGYLLDGGLLQWNRINTVLISVGPLTLTQGELLIFIISIFLITLEHPFILDNTIGFHLALLFHKFIALLIH